MNNLDTSIGALELGDAAALFGAAALEQAAAGPVGPTANLHMPMCRHIDDSMLEQSAKIAMNPPTTNFMPPCRHIDDGALEQAGTQTASPLPTRLNTPWQCH